MVSPGPCVGRCVSCWQMEIGKVKRTLLCVEARERLRVRLESVQPGDRQLWGRMNAHQMLRHVSDAMKMMMGEMQVSNCSHLLWRFVKWGALYAPTRWPKGISAPPELDQSRLEEPTCDFAQTRKETVQALDRLVSIDMAGKWHPFFGSLTHAQWMRWGYRHADHHLRQFGR
jgi:hypothetical protein